MTRKREIRPGDVFGRWTALEETLTTDSGAIKRRCRCDCGQERYVLETSLRYGGSQSCGCLRRERAEKANVSDLTGRHFGDLTVIRRLENTKSGASRWLCECNCGSEYVANGSLLVKGRRTRCTGKMHQKNYVYADISGKRFDRLVALYPSKRYDKSGSVIWRCQCDCGEVLDVSYNSLMYGNQKSCGCQKKEHDRKLQTFLTHVAGTSIDMLKSKKVPADNTTGHKGVYLIRGKYVAKIVFQKRQYFLGTYDNIEDAVKVRKEAENTLFDRVTEHYKLWRKRADDDPEWAALNPIQVTVDQIDKQLKITLVPDL